jgi:hypothetical protein
VAALRSTNPSAWAKAQARALARSMLARQKLPPHARLVRLGQYRPRWLQAAAIIGGAERPIDIGRVYLVRLPEPNVINFLEAHEPKGATGKSDGTDSSGPTTEEFVGYSPTAMPDGVCGAFLVGSMLPATSDRTWLRLDAQAVWCLPRSAAEHLAPARYRAVVVTNDRLGSARVSKRFTSRRVIAELARKLNAMPISHAGGDFCPAFGGGYRLTFEPRPGAAKRVVATAEPCESVLLSVGGKSQPLLADTTGLGPLVDRLLGVR